MNESKRVGRLSAVRGVLVILGTLLLLTLLLAGPASAAQGEYFPGVIILPDGFQPEGIVVNWKGVFFAGSLADGAIYRGDVVTGEGDILVEGEEGRIAVGLAYDPRTDQLWVAGGATGQAHVYDASSGESLATYQLSDPEDEGTFVNDVAVTLSGAYFTDSFRPYLYRVPLSIGQELPDEDEVEEIELTGDFEFEEGAFNANGIDAPFGGGVVLVVNSTLGTLYWVEPETGRAVEIDLGEDTLTNGDGILLDGDTVYVVQNQKNQIAVVRLDASLLSGVVVRHITDDNFDVPTTVGDYYDFLYAVNARFGTSPEPDTQYSVVRVPKY
jgi:DNA-binding beta-propeller fold protein YncE